MVVGVLVDVGVALVSFFTRLAEFGARHIGDDQAPVDANVQNKERCENRNERGPDQRGGVPRLTVSFARSLLVASSSTRAPTSGGKRPNWQTNCLIL